MQESRSYAARTRLIGGLLGLLLLVLISLAIASILVFPAWLHPPLTEQELAGVRDPRDRLAAQDARRQRQDAARATLLQGVGALLVFTSAGVGAYFTWRQVRHNREQLEATREQLVTAREQLEVARQGQVTERFTRAIDQLGSDQLDIRLGGIYALERIARDSEVDRPTIGEILTAYIRTHARWPPTRPGQYVADAPLHQMPSLQSRAPDVQASLTVLGRGDFSTLADADTDGNRLDLRKADLRKAVLYGAHLEGAILHGAHLEGATLIKAHLEGATLYGAHLQGASLHKAHLERATLYGAHLEGAALYDAHLEGAILASAHLEGATLTGARLEGAIAEDSTRWPAGFDWQAAGVVRVEPLGRPVRADSGTAVATGQGVSQPAAAGAGVGYVAPPDGRDDRSDPAVDARPGSGPSP